MTPREAGNAASGRTPTERQYRSLLALGSGSAGLSWTKGQAEPMLKHGWITADWHAPYYQWIRITAEGLHALARAVAKYGLPKMTSGRRYEKFCVRCEKPWKPRCSCGSQSYHLSVKEHDRAAA